MRPYGTICMDKSDMACRYAVSPWMALLEHHPGSRIFRPSIAPMPTASALIKAPRRSHYKKHSLQDFRKGL